MGGAIHFNLNSFFVPGARSHERMSDFPLSFSFTEIEASSKTNCLRARSSAKYFLVLTILSSFKRSMEDSRTWRMQQYRRTRSVFLIRTDIWIGLKKRHYDKFCSRFANDSNYVGRKQGNCEMNRFVAIYAT